MNGVKTPGGTFLAVLVYCLFDLLLLLSTLAHRQLWDVAGSRYCFTICIAQLFLIPGVAALFSVLLYGQHKWTRRAIGVIAIGALVPVALGFVLLALLAVPPASLNGRSLTVLFLLIASPVIFGVVRLVRVSSVWAMQREAANWACEREQVPDRNARRQRVRAIRVASAIPVLLVGSVYLFFFPLWGLLTHVGRQRPEPLAGFEVNVPLSSVILATEMVDDRNSYLDVIAPCQSLTLPGLKPKCMYGWNISTSTLPPHEPYKQPLGIPRENLRIAGEDVVCRELPWGLPRRWTDRRCIGSGRLRAAFWGPTDQLPAFFAVLNSVR